MKRLPKGTLVNRQCEKKNRGKNGKEKKKSHLRLNIFYKLEAERREEARHEKITQKKIHDDIFQLHIKSI